MDQTSRFNLFYPLDNAVAVFNSVSGKWAEFSKKDADRLKKNRPDLLSKALREQAKSIGAVIPENHDEIRWFQDNHHQMMTDRSTATYIWALTFLCNLTCPYCFEGEDHSRVEMSKAMCERLIRAVQRRAEREKTRRLAVMLFGGEPLLKRAECVLILRTLKEWCQERSMEFRGLISTNGVLLTSTVVKELSPYLNGAQLTLDGPREIHNSLRVGRNRKPTFDRILDAVQILADKKIAVHLRLQVHNTDAHRLTELLGELRESGVLPNPFVRVSAAMVRDNQWCRSCESFSGYVQSGSEEERRSIELIEKLVPTGRPAAQIVPCVMAHNQVCIDPKGDLFRCITDVGDAKCRVGYLHATDDKFVFTKRMKEYDSRDPTRWETCHACAYLPLCGGGCPRRAYHAHGSFDGPACNESKLVLDTRIERLIRQERQVTARAAVNL
jgi:uncharacterized protein